MAKRILSWEDVTPAWASALLRKSGYDVTVSSLTATPIGTGQVGATYRYCLTYDGEQGNAPASIVGKFESENETSRDAGKLNLTYLREAAFYRNFAGQKPLPVPHKLLIDFDEESHDFALIMDDFPNHYAGNQLRLPTERESELAMDAAAAFHAAWWGDQTLDTLDWLNGSAASIPPFDSDDCYANFWPAFCDRYGDRVSPAMRTVGEAFLGKVKLWQESFGVVPRCLIHNDFRPDNMLFQPDDPARPVVVVDWQTVGVGCGASDIAYYLGTAFDAENRRTVEQRLFARYRDRLLERGIPAADTDDLWPACTRAAIAGFNMGVTASMMVVQTPRGDEMFLAMCSRSAAMVLDHKDTALAF